MFDAHQIIARLRLNLGAHFFGYIVTVMNQVLLLPVFLFFWPKTQYGEWLVLSAIPVYISLSDFGMEVVGGNRMSMAVAHGDYKTANVFLQTYFVFQTAILSSILAATLCIAALGLFPKWLSIAQVSPGDVNLAMVLLIIRALLACQVGIFRAIYRSNFLTARGVFLSNLCRFTDFVTTTLAVALGCGVLGLSITMLVVHVVVVTYMYVDSRLTCPQFQIGWKHFSMAELRSVLGEGVAFQLIPASVMIMMQGMTLVVNYTLGPIAVVAYNATRVLYRTSFVGVQMVGWAIAPEFSILYARRDFLKLSRLFKMMMQCLLWFSLFVALIMALAGSFAVTVLTYGKVYVYGWFLIVFALGVLTNGFWNGASVLLTATNRHIGFAKALFGFSIFMVPLSVVLIRLFGLTGAPLATLIVDLMVCPFVWQACRGIFKEKEEMALTSLFAWPDISKLWQFVLARQSRGEAKPDGGNSEPMATDPLVSIFISSYNYERFVGAAIESALSQTYRNIEVIVVDDGSTDNSRQVLESFRGRDPRLKIIYQENKGQAASINTAFYNSSGEVFFTLDSDDYLMPEAVEKVMAAYRPGVAGFHFRLKVEDDFGKPMGLFPPLKVPLSSGRCDLELLKYGYYVTPVTSGKAFVRSYAEKMMPIPEQVYKMCADLYWETCIILFGEIAAVDEPLGVWRQHGKNHHLTLDVRFSYGETKFGADMFRSTQKDLERIAGGLGIKVPREVIFREQYRMRLRAIEWRTCPPEKRKERESLARLLIDSVKSELIYSKRGLLLGFRGLLWYAAVFFSPGSGVPYPIQLFNAVRPASRKESEITKPVKPYGESLVSIIINNYNYGRYIRGAIESAVNQTYGNVEVIVVDDGSTDDSREIIESCRGDKVRVIYQKNGGQAAAMNTGFKESRGDIILFLDADDYLLPYTVATVVSIQTPATAAFHYRLREEGLHGELAGFYPPLGRSLDSGRCDGILLRSGHYVTPVTSGKAFVRGALEKIMPIPEKEFVISADAYLEMGIVFYGEMAAMDEALAVRRMHGENLSLVASLGFDYPRVKKQIEFVRTCQVMLERFGKKLGVDIPANVLFRDTYQLRFRVIAWKICPRTQSDQPEPILSLLWDCFCAIWIYSPRSFFLRIKESIWYLGMFSIPSPLMPALFRLFSEAKRTTRRLLHASQTA